jgi:hypothetical protein
MIIDNAPFLDFLQGSKAAETGVLVIEAAIPYAGRLGAVVDISHLRIPKGRF